MSPAAHRFDLVLSYPQWQGSGRPQHLLRGARAAAQVCGRYGPTVKVPDAGEGEADGGINRWTALLSQFQAAQTLLAQHAPRRILTAGGDCACDIAVIDYLQRQYSDLTVVWVDAHLDANTALTSPSGNFHGMPVSAILGASPAALRPFLGAPLATSRFRYVSAHVGDPGDWSFQRERQLTWLEPGQMIDGPVHVHFDLDALDPAEFPHVAYPEGKLPVASGLSLLQAFAATRSVVGLTITEFAPADERGAAEGSELIDRLCAAAG